MITSTQSEASITPLARNSDPITSHAAADQAQAMRHAHHTAILGALRTGAMGKDDIAHFTALTGVQIARRLPELQKLGLVRPTGRTVRSDTGRQEREWEAV